MSTHPEERKVLSDTPVVEYLISGKQVATVNIRLTCQGNRVSIACHVVPVTRVGRTLPDWPEALSLKPNLAARAN